MVQQRGAALWLIVDTCKQTRQEMLHKHINLNSKYTERSTTNITQISTAIEGNCQIHCAAVHTTYWPKPKITPKPSYFPNAFRPEGKYEG